MNRRHNLIWVVVFVFVAGGCATGKKLDVKVYSQDMPRVDQDLEGNHGYVMGTAKDAPANDVKKTRRIYVLDVLKETDNVPVSHKQIKEDGATAAITPAGAAAEEPAAQNADASPAVVIPNLDEVQPLAPKGKSSAGNSARPAALAGGEKEYKIEKDDTLQKISKKFFHTYGKWLKIYNANKDVIKDPNRLKPGTMIRIPNI
ncbi:MAG: LysM peptidoglycan-binding domain-containing protein [Candidatus Omnitrophica bacterium]|nr:LysM peptidoglycan-binding domain-containing protein [Candidatus Omnitrophota bacterium]